MEQKRQLAAIMFTDIVGYTAMMEQDEETASAAVDRYRSVLEAIVAEHNGKVKHYYGDGALILFSTATDATRCGLALQLEYQQEPVVPLRVGLHIGEIMIKGDEIYGPGINLASRIESLGKPGTVLFSKNIHEKIRNKREFSSISLGPFDFKNVEEPVEVFALTNEGLPVPSVDEVAAKLKEPKASKGLNKSSVAIVGAMMVAALIAIYFLGRSNVGGTPKHEHASIAVLPFTNMSSDAENEFFCDGVTEDILTHLSKLKNLKVISRTSIMHFKGSELSLREIAEKLDVEYILEGSVRKQGDQVAITAQLIHADNDGHLWAEKYQRELKDVFLIQSEVAQEIARVLNVKISMAEQQGLRKSPTNSVEAYQLYMEGRKAADKREVPGLKRSIDLFKKAIELDPLYVEAYGDLAQSILFMQEWQYGYWDRDSCFEASESILNEAIEIDPNNYRVYTTWANFYYQKMLQTPNRELQLELTQKRFDAAERSVELNPNDAYSRFVFGQAFWDGLTGWDTAMAHDQWKKAIELDPYSSIINNGYLDYLDGAGFQEERNAHFEKCKGVLSFQFVLKFEYVSIQKTGDLAGALVYAIDEVEHGPKSAYVYEFIAKEVWIISGDEDKAMDYLDEALQLDPSSANKILEFMVWDNMTTSAEEFLNRLDLQDQFEEDQRQWANGMIEWQKGNYEVALELLQPLFEEAHEKNIFSYHTFEALIRAELGETELGLSYIDHPDLRNAEKYKATYWLVMGKKDPAYAWLEATDVWEVLKSRTDPLFRKLWGEARYEALLREHGVEPLETHKK